MADSIGLRPAFLRSFTSLWCAVLDILSWNRICRLDDDMPIAEEATDPRADAPAPKAMAVPGAINGADATNGNGIRNGRLVRVRCTLALRERI